MKNGDGATLYMKKTLRAGDILDETIYSSTVLQYNETAENIYFRLETGELAKLTLDAIYECKIETEKEGFVCTGRIKDRYCGRSGRIFRFEIENGFYKINLK